MVFAARQSEPESLHAARTDLRLTPALDAAGIIQRTHIRQLLADGGWNGDGHKASLIHLERVAWLHKSVRQSHSSPRGRFRGIDQSGICHEEAGD